MSGGTLTVDRRFRRIGRIKKASGTNDPQTFAEINVMLTKLLERGRLDILRCIQDATYSVLQVFDAYRRDVLDRLPGLPTPFRSSEEEVARLAEELRLKIADVEAQRRALTLQEVKGAVKREREAGKRVRAQNARDRREAIRLASLLRRAERDLAEARTASCRVPLPKPEGWERPKLDSKTVLCDSLDDLPEVIYGLVDPLDPELVRYVGRACDPVGRYRGHCTAGTEAVTGWIKTLRAEGRLPVMVLLESCDSGATGAREAYWIHYYRERFQADLNRAIPKKLEIVA